MAQTGTNLFSKINISTSKNPLIINASEILGYLVAIPSQQHPSDLIDFRYKLMLAISLYSETVSNAGIDKLTLQQCQRIICDAVDDAIFTTQWGKTAQWDKASLANDAFPDRNTEKDLFYLLSQAQLSPEDNIDLLEFFYVILMLGYEGRFQTGDKKRLLGIKNELFRLIKQYRTTPVLSSTEPYKRRERPLKDAFNELDGQNSKITKQPQKESHKKQKKANIKPLSSSPLIQPKKKRTFNVVVIIAMFIIFICTFFLFAITQFSDTYDTQLSGLNNAYQLQQELEVNRDSLTEKMDILKNQPTQISKEYPSAKESKFIVEQITDWRIELGTFSKNMDTSNIVIPIENSGMIVNKEEKDNSVTLYLTFNGSKSEADLLKESIEAELKLLVTLIDLNPKKKKAPDVP